MIFYHDRNISNKQPNAPCQGHGKSRTNQPKISKLVEVHK
jgi:hypothetical protein